MKWILCLSTWFWLGVTMAADAPTTWLTLPSTINYDLTDEDTSGVASARIPIFLGPQSPPLANLIPRLRDVVFRNAHSDPLAKAFHADFSPADKDHGDALVIRVATNFLSSGTYSLILDLTQTGEAASQPTHQPPITLTLQRPAPDLLASPSVSVSQVRSLWGVKGNPGRLLLQERSGKTCVSSVGFTPSADRMDGTGALKVDPSNGNIPAGGCTSFSIKTDGLFPLGRSTGKLQIRARELEKPLEIAYEVLARRTPFWIPVLVLCGFLAGLLIRHVLQNYQDKADAKIAASEAIKTLRQANDDVGDSGFRAAISKIIKDLQKAVANAATPEAIKADTKTALDALASKKKDLDASLSHLHLDIQPLCDVLHKVWQLPKRARAPLDEGVSAIDVVVGLVDLQDACGGNDALKKALRAEVRNLVAVLNQWRYDTALYLQEMAKDSPPPIRDFDSLVAAINDWRNKFAAAAVNPQSITAADLSSALLLAHQAYFSANEIARFVTDSAQKLLQLLDDKRSALNQVGESPDTVSKKTQNAAQAISSDLEQPDSALVGLRRHHHDATAAWQQLLLSWLPADADSTAVAQLVKDAINKNNFSQAITEAARAASKTVAAAATGKTVPTPPAPTSTGGHLLLSLAPIPLANRAPLFLTRKLILTGGPKERDRLGREKWWASLLQTVLLCLLFAAIAYAIYEKNWVGTVYEMIGIFAWAFGVDISSDAVLTAAKRIKLSEG